MRSCSNWTNRLTRSVVTMLTHHRHVHSLRILSWNFHVAVGSYGSHLLILFGFFQSSKIRREVTIDAHPMHIAVTTNLVFSYNRNIVLCVTCSDTSTTTNTASQIDGHSPSVTYILYWMLCPQIHISYRNTISLGCNLSITIDIMVHRQCVCCVPRSLSFFR